MCTAVKSFFLYDLDGTQLNIHQLEDIWVVFCFGALTHKAAISNCGQIGCTYFSFLWDKCPKVKSRIIWQIYVSLLIKLPVLFPRVAVPFYMLPNNVWEVYEKFGFSYPHLHLTLSHFLLLFPPYVSLCCYN